MGTSGGCHGYSVTVSSFEDRTVIGLEPDGSTWRWEVVVAPFPKSVRDDEEAATTLAASFVTACIDSSVNREAMYWVLSLVSKDYTLEQINNSLDDLRRLLGDDAERLAQAMYRHVCGLPGARTAMLLSSEINDSCNDVEEAVRMMREAGKIRIIREGQA